MKLNAIIAILVLVAVAISGCEMALQNNNETVTENTTQVIIDVPMKEKEESVMPQDSVIPTDGVIIEAVEGDLVHLKPEAVDPDKDVVTYYFTKPFTESGKWQTKEGDAGKYLVTVTASDGKMNSSQDVIIVLHKANKAPVIECPPEIIVKEGDELAISCNIYDPEGDSVIIEYAGFMKTSNYKTTFNDAGEYTVQVKAKDKNRENSKSIKIIIQDVNRAPEIKNIADIVKAMEEDIITLLPEAIDADGNKVTLTFSEPFDAKGVWKTKIGDAGSHRASVVASDGKTTTKKEFLVEIGMKNTAPVLKKINDITVYEGEIIKIPVEVTDRENDKVKVDVKGWMNSLEYTTGYADAGEYSVTVVASDAQYESKQTFKVTVLDKNRAPVFKIPA
jgi:hypothetical protein